MKVYGVTGYARHGKNTVADMISDERPGVVTVAFADSLREMARAINPMIEPNLRYTDALFRFGYDDAKNIPEVRRFLQVLGTEAVRGVLGPDVWIDALNKRLADLDERSPDATVVVTDVRFENEVEYIKRVGTLIAVMRVTEDGGEFDNGVSKTHPSESYILRARGRADYGLKASNLDQLRGQVRTMLDLETLSE